MNEVNFSPGECLLAGMFFQIIVCVFGSLMNYIEGACRGESRNVA